MKIVTRFAPSPTGFLHIGGARTALFNWLYARGGGGTFLLRIEDTDRERSTKPAIDAILDGMAWLGLNPDLPPIFQFSRAERHREAAEALIAKGAAFRCYVTPQELEERRANAQRLAEAARDTSLPEAERSALKAQAALAQTAFRSPYRDGLKPPSPSAPYVVRLRAPDDGEIVIDDQVQGTVRTPARELDDLILLRTDATPTYMLAVVVDDQDMGVTHVIRGDDHLTNAARQVPIIDAMGWTRPTYAHIPMIHGQDGAKLSKRHGALAVQAYRDLGYLPEALLSYLMRLGWSPGHDDILTTDQAIKAFSLDQIGKAPARLDLDKLAHVNAHFIKQADPNRLVGLARDAAQSRTDMRPPWPTTEDFSNRLLIAAPFLRTRAKTIVEFADQADFIALARPLALDERGERMMNQEARERLNRLLDSLSSIAAWDEVTLAQTIKDFTNSEGVGMGKIGPPLRTALTGSAAAPELAQILYVLGRNESLARVGDQAAKAPAGS
ncbi:MAG: glutamate--tRNA ligase [Caulobacterales bacterium]